MRKFLPKTINNPSGFTLIELMVVVAIIAILSVIGMVVFASIQKNARNARRVADVEAISKAWEVHYANGKYPTLDGSWFSTGVIPLDPTASSYTYTAIPAAGATTYSVCTTKMVADGASAELCLKGQQND